MASIGEDDLFDEEIVKLYLKEVTFITLYIISCISEKEEEKEQENKQDQKLHPRYCVG